MEFTLLMRDRVQRQVDPSVSIFPFQSLKRTWNQRIQSRETKQKLTHRLSDSLNLSLSEPSVVDKTSNQQIRNWKQKSKQNKSGLKERTTIIYKSKNIEKFRKISPQHISPALKKIKSLVLQRELDRLFCI